MKKDKPTQLKLSLYLISNSRKINYDMYDSAVVVAWNEEDAKWIHPGKETFGDDFKEWWTGEDWLVSSWCLPEEVEVQLLGQAKEGFKPNQVVCASFNAG